MAGAFGVMGVFLLYPLEGAHILKTKLFLFAFSALYLLGDGSGRLPNKTIAAMLLALLPVAVTAVAKPLRNLRTETAVLRGEAGRSLGLPLEKKIAVELERQLDVIARSIGDSPYYVIDSGSNLSTLLTLHGNHAPQYYMEMRPGILNQEATDAILEGLQLAPFALVRTEDYERYAAERGGDPFLTRIISHLRDNHSVVGRYEASSEQSPAVEQMYSFLILKRKTP